jgi:hypothetical protein
MGQAQSGKCGGYGGYMADNQMAADSPGIGHLKDEKSYE